MNIQGVIVVFMLLCSLIGCSGETSEKVRPDTAHEEDMERFLAFVKGDFRAKWEDVEPVFHRCFKEGDSALKYRQIFRTTEELVHDGEKVYIWEWRQGGGNAFEVVVGSDDRIRSAMVIQVWSN